MDKKTPQTKVKVIVRVRPALKKDAKTCLTADGNKIHIVNHRNKMESLQYEFCSVYNDSSTQQTIFSETVLPMLQNAFHGQNVSVFAYGPTGAGKTHTMLGVLSDPGIIPRTVQSIFKMIADEVDSDLSPNHPKPQHTVTFSYMEIYNEKVQDLLKAGNSDLPIREDASHNIFVAGLTEKKIENFEDFKNCFGPASSNRTVAATKLNEASSRSHSLLMLKIVRRAQGKVYRGKVYLVDLAGSEDNRRTGNQGIRMKESAAINKSLFVLGEVVDAINQNQIRIPYRNSKLTRLLQDSIGGSCHSIMITNIAPEQHYYYDSYCTLNFATKSKKIVNVNTTTVKSNSPPQVKPTAQLQPTKRRSESFQPPSKSKKPRRSSIAETSNAAVVLPSPILRRQAEFESQVNEKLKILMEKVKRTEDMAAVSQLKEQLAKGMSSIPTPVKLSSSSSTPSLGASRRRTYSVSPGSRRKSVRIAKESNVSQSEETQQYNMKSGDFVTSSRGDSSTPAGDTRSPDIIDPTPNKSEDTGQMPPPEPLKDRTNVLYQHYLKGKGKRHKSNIRTLLDDECSLSPLFLKKKKTKSVTDTPEVVDKKEKKIKEAPFKFVNDDQLQRNFDFLEILNTASVKELQKLQKVGVKRAQMIFDYRQMNGTFDFVEDLKNIPGFTENFLKSLKKSNLLIETNEQAAE